MDKFKTVPFTHQLHEYNIHADTPARALFWEQGTGKTKTVLDAVAKCYRAGKINTLIVLAPNMVHRNWVVDEIPTHLGVDEYTAFAYESSKSGSKHQQQSCMESLTYSGLSIVTMTYEAACTDLGKVFLKKLLLGRKCYYVLDEATRIKNPTAKRTKTVVASGKYAKYKRVLTGTPITSGAFDIYAPVNFLDAEFWKGSGLGSYAVFKKYFGIFETGYNHASGTQYERLLGFQRLDELNALLGQIAGRVLKEDVLDLPPKVYSRVYFELSADQKRVYRQLKNDYIAELAGGTIEANLALTRLLLLHQVTCGYATLDGELISIPGENPRLNTLLELIEDIHTPTIIWCRFTKDIAEIEQRLGGRMVRFDGKIDSGMKATNLAKFRAGEAQFFVSTTDSGGTGLTLNEADTVIYYSNNYKLENRLQSEDRCHRAGQNQSVRYIDIIASDTVDDHIVNALRKKLNIAQIITGDKIRGWI